MKTMKRKWWPFGDWFVLMYPVTLAGLVLTRLNRGSGDNFIYVFAAVGLVLWIDSIDAWRREKAGKSGRGKTIMVTYPLLLAALALWWLIRRAPMPGFWVVAAVGLVLWGECAVALWRARREE